MNDLKKLDEIEIEELRNKIADCSLNEIYIIQQKIKDHIAKIKQLESEIQSHLNYVGDTHQKEKGIKLIIEDELQLKEKEEFEAIMSPEIKDAAELLNIDLINEGVIKIVEEFKISKLQALQKRNPAAMDLSNYISWIPKKDREGNIKRNWILEEK